MRSYGSIAELPQGIDLFSREDWTTCLTDAEGLSHIASARSPLFSPGLPLRYHFAWIVDADTGKLEYAFARERVQLKTGVASGPYQRNRDKIRLCIILSTVICENHRHAPELSAMFPLMKGLLEHEVDSNDAITRLENYERTSIVRWWHIRDKAICVLMPKKSLYTSAKEVDAAGAVIKSGPLPGEDGSDPRHSANEYISEAAEKLATVAGKLFDYTYFRFPVWRSCPLKYLSNLPDKDRKIRFFADPMSFTPGRTIATDAFLWPWQRCLKRDVGAGDERVRHVPIETISLVLDLRFSTVAMEFSDVAEGYADLIDGTVEIAKKVILESGGFFDKETGDGVVAHYSADLLEFAGNKRLNVYSHVLEACRQVIDKVSLVCSQAQEQFEHGLDGLAPSIGVHIGNAIWIADESRVRAIGSSVVGAARLCGTARSGEVLASNRFRYRAIEVDRDADRFRFERRQIAMKERSPDAEVYAYSVSFRAGSG
ncbi:MAG: hypothetical protein RIM84_15625 [Alphaproteobacteria bacterium]